MTDRKTKSKQSEPNPLTGGGGGEEPTVEKLPEPGDEPQDELYWKSYQLFFTSGNASGKLFGFLVTGSNIGLDNLNNTLLAGSNVRAMDIRAPDDIVNDKYVDSE